MLTMELRAEEDERVLSLGRRCVIFWCMAVTCWVNDRVFCSWWASVGFPYLHGAWHILIFLASYTAIVLFAYFDVKQHRPGLVAELRLDFYQTFQRLALI